MLCETCGAEGAKLYCCWPARLCLDCARDRGNRELQQPNETEAASPQVAGSQVFRKGTVARHYELIGIRPAGYGAELLFVVDHESTVRDFLSEGMPDRWAIGFASYRMLQPGDVRPVDAVATPETQWGIGDADFDDWAFEWVFKYDLRTASPAELRRLYGDDLERLARLHGDATVALWSPAQNDRFGFVNLSASC